MFLIGEFSRISQVAKSQLRYYDEIGLLKPAEIDQWTSYRYYSLEQLPIIHRIMALRELGLSLDQIKRLIADDVSVDEIRGMYLLRKNQIEQTVKDELHRLRVLEARLNHLENQSQLDEPDVILKSIPEQLIVGTRIQLPSLFDVFGIVQQMQTTLPATIGKENLGFISVLFHSSFFESKEVDITLGYLLNTELELHLTLPSGIDIQTQMLPAIPLAASTVRPGGPENNVESHGRVGRWALENGYSLAGEGRELVISPPRSASDRTGMVTEVQIPVIKRENPSLPSTFES